MAKKKGKGKAKIEWNIFVGFLMMFAVWYFLLTPFLEKIADNEGIVIGTLVAFFVFFGVYFGLFVILGNDISKGARNALTLLILYIILGTWDYPMVIPRSGVINLEASQSISSDLAFYLIFISLGIPHGIARAITYILIPSFGIFIILYMYSGKELKKKLWDGLMG